MQNTYLNMNLIKKLRSEFILLLYKVAYLIKPRLSADLMYYRAFGKRLNLDNPKTLIEKITWLQFNTDTSLWTLCADKYRVREYVKSKGLGHILTELYGVWENIDDIDFSILPNKYVLKANNGCGTVMPIHNNNDIDDKAIKKTLKKWIRRPYGYLAAQFHYLPIKRCVIAEQLLEESDYYKLLSPHSLVDYKIWCFNGEPECVMVIFDRSPGYTKQAVYDLEWNNISSYVYASSCYYEHTLPKPVNFDEMLRYARILSKDFIQVRVDFYNIDGKIYFGELTLSAGYGDMKEEYYAYLGSRFELPIE